MPYYAKIVDGVVVDVISAEIPFIKANFPNDTWLKTSFNIHGGVYYDPLTDEPHEDQTLIEKDEGRKRKNYAGISFKYDEELDAFIPPKPFDSWVLNKETCLWEPPIERPDDEHVYVWNEEIKNWQKEQ